MSPPRPRRRLSAEERALWAQVARGVRPLPGRAVPEGEPERPAEPAPPVPPAVGAAPAAPKRPGPTLPPLAPMERRTLTALRRGSRAVDASIDLHGMRQAEAHAALEGFLRRAQASGHALVLVVTGKGAEAAPASLFEERGVLRRVVPHWLRRPELRPLIVGFEEAAPQHGGAGALYVRLRRRRGPS